MVGGSREATLIDDETSLGDGGAHATRHGPSVVGGVHGTTLESVAIDAPARPRVKDRDVRILTTHHRSAVCAVTHPNVVFSKLRDSRRTTAQYLEERPRIARRCERLEGQRRAVLDPEHPGRRLVE